MPEGARDSPALLQGPVEVEVRVEVEVHRDSNVVGGNLPEQEGVSHTVTRLTRHQQRPRRRVEFSSFPFRRASVSCKAKACWNDTVGFFGGGHQWERRRRIVGIYAAGVLFSMAYWTFLDALVLSALENDDRNHSLPSKNGEDHQIAITFMDWLPGLCSLCGYVTINFLVNIEALSEPDDQWMDMRIASRRDRARTMLALGIALLAGGMISSVIILFLKYIPTTDPYAGYANVAQNVLLAVSAALHWRVRGISSENEYRVLSSG
ncbi:Vacuolar protein sorting-associated protein 68 [Marasmius tenuissimus]|nr:Vacuolar protein sorting-associated protein 68 [Marasmius tenuissimus]